LCLAMALLGSQERPWKHILKISNVVDRSFFSSTRIPVGDGKSASF
jgi:hypothetical protein